MTFTNKIEAIKCIRSLVYRPVHIWLKDCAQAVRRGETSVGNIGLSQAKELVESIVEMGKVYYVPGDNLVVTRDITWCISCDRAWADCQCAHPERAKQRILIKRG